MFEKTMKDFWKKYKLVMTVLMYVFVVFAGVRFFGAPLVNKVRDISYKIQAAQIDEQTNKSRLEKLPQLEADWEDYQSKKENLNVILSQADQIRFIESVEAISNQTGNTIALNISEASDPKEIAKLKSSSKQRATDQKSILDGISSNNFIPIQIELKGNYSGLVNFLYMLENSQFYVNVISLNAVKKIVSANENQISPSDAQKNTENKGKDIIETTINAIVYTQKQ